MASTEKSKKAIRRGNRAFVTKVIQTATNAIDKSGGTQTERDILEGYKVTLIDKTESLKKLDEAILKGIGNENFYCLYQLNIPTEYLIFGFRVSIGLRCSEKW